jgi:hypothetical protein
MKFSTIFNTLLTGMFAMLIISCDPLEDAYDEIDQLAEESGVDAGITIEYTMVEGDYATVANSLRANATASDSTLANFIEDNNVLTADVDASTQLSAIVNEEFPQFQKGAAVQVTYNLLESTLEELGATNSEYLENNYTLSSEDYASVSSQAGSAGFFDRNIDVSNELPVILNDQVRDAQEGDIYSVTYEFVDIAYSELTGETIYNEGFATTLNGYESISLVGDQEWAWGTFGEDTYARISGFSGGAVPNQDWLVSPEIDLSGEDGDITLLLSQILNFQGAAEFGQELDILFTTDYTGDVATTEWVSVGANLSSYPSGDNYDLHESEVALPNAQGNTIRLAFYYESTTDFAALWEVVNIRLDVGAAPETSEINELYEFTGTSWRAINEGAYYLNSDDYDSFGEQSGQPGAFDNFSSSVSPDDYLPRFLEYLMPYAQEGDEFVVVYDYFSGTTSARATTYVYTNGTWNSISFEDVQIEKTDQFKNTGNGFVFDPSVEIFMSSADYQIIVDEVAKTRPELLNSFETAEDYYGADAFFENFDIRVDSRDTELQPEYAGLSKSEAEALIQERLLEGLDVFLTTKYADAQPVPGIQVLYTVNYATYDGNDGTGSQTFELVGVGEFELIESN